MNRRAMLAIAAGFAAALPSLVMPGNGATAQPWPQRPVKLILPLGAGSASRSHDAAFRRTIVHPMGSAGPGRKQAGRRFHRRHQRFRWCEGRSCAAVAAGDTLYTTHRYTHQNLPYDAARDLVPIAGLARATVSIAANQALKVNSLADLVTLARAQPGKLNWAAISSMDDFLFAGFLKQNDLAMARVPYRNPVEALNDLSEGRIDVVMSALALALPRTQGGKAKILAVVNPQRSPLVPDVPTAAEAGFPALTYEPIVGLFAPSGMPAAVRERIADDLQAVAADPAIAARLGPSGQIVSFMPAADFAAAIEQHRDNLAALAQLLGVKPTQ